MTFWIVKVASVSAAFKSAALIGGGAAEPLTNILCYHLEKTYVLRTFLWGLKLVRVGCSRLVDVDRLNVEFLSRGRHFDI